MSKDDPCVSRIRKAGDRRKPRPGRTREETAFARSLRRDVSKTEDRLWPHLRAGQMGAPFRRQHVIDHGFPDYCCVPLKLIVEIDGPHHDPFRDMRKDRRMSRRGYDTLRFGVQEVDRNLQGVVDTIHAQVQLRLMQMTNRDRRTQASHPPPVRPPSGGRDRVGRVGR